MGKKRKDKNPAQPAVPAQQDYNRHLKFQPDVLSWLIAPEGRDQFLSDVWEKRPLLIKGGDAKKAVFRGLFDYPKLISLVQKREKASLDPLEFSVDVNAARYVDGVRTTPNGEVVDETTLNKLYRTDGCTLQVHQPQRFDDVLWRLLAAMEADFGCLVGCNTYLTPKGTQGLAPHHDDVEIFVCQTAGTKRWRLYEPLNGFHLPNRSSGNLTEAVLSAPIMEVNMEVGDVLYMPRGTVHQAVAQTEDSAHVTISTYQRWAMQDLLGEVVLIAHEARSEPSCMPLTMRQGLPLGFLFGSTLMGQALPGRVGPSPALLEASGRLAAGLRDLAERLEKQHDLTAAAAHTLALDFLRMRLPPHPSQLAGKGPEPVMEDSVAVRGRGLFMLLPVPAEACEGMPDLEQGAVKLCTSLANERECHMMGPGSDMLMEDGSGSEGEDGDEDEDEEGQGAPEAAERPHKSDKASCKRTAAPGAGPGRGGAAAAAAAAPGSAPEADGSDSDGDEDEEGSGSESEEVGHAFPGQEIPGVIFPLSYAPALAQVLASSPAAPVALRQLVHLTEHQQLQLGFELWAEGFVATIRKQPEGTAGQNPKRAKHRA